MTLARHRLRTRRDAYAAFGRRRAPPAISLELRDKTRRDLALAEIAAAVEAAEGNAVHAAERLGVSHRSLMRWISEHPKLELRVRQIRGRYDHPHEVGSPTRRKA